MIISGQGDKSTELYNIADAFAQTLHMVKVADLDTKEDNDELYKDAGLYCQRKGQDRNADPVARKEGRSVF